MRRWRGPRSAQTSRSVRGTGPGRCLPLEQDVEERRLIRANVLGRPEASQLNGPGPLGSHPELQLVSRSARTSAGRLQRRQRSGVTSCGLPGAASGAAWGLVVVVVEVELLRSRRAPERARAQPPARTGTASREGSRSDGAQPNFTNLPRMRLGVIPQPGQMYTPPKLKASWLRPIGGLMNASASVPKANSPRGGDAKSRIFLPGDGRAATGSCETSDGLQADGALAQTLVPKEGN